MSTECNYEAIIKYTWEQVKELEESKKATIPGSEDWYKINDVQDELRVLADMFETAQEYGL